MFRSTLGIVVESREEQPQLVRCVVAKCSCHRGQMLGPGRFRPRTPCVEAENEIVLAFVLHR